MADLYVSYYSGVQYGVGKGPAGTDVVSTSGTSEKSTDNDGSPVVSVFSDAAHYVNTGPSASVTATIGTGVYLPANTLLWLALNPGDEVAAITV